MPLSVAGLGHHYRGGPWLFRDLNHSFEDGCLTAVVGPSGTGKSTLLQVLAGALTPAEGTVDRDAHSEIAIISQTAVGVRRRTVIDHIGLPLLASGLSRGQAERESAEIAALFRIEELLGVPYQQLSAGEAQRLMLAVAVAQHPDIVLADEPTSALDVGNATEVIQVLRGLSSGGAVVVIATHDDRVRSACDRVLDLVDLVGQGASS